MLALVLTSGLSTEALTKTYQPTTVSDTYELPTLPELHIFKNKGHYRYICRDVFRCMLMLNSMKYYDGGLDSAKMIYLVHGDKYIQLK